MKKNNRGFMLVETLIVSVFILSTLIFLYVQYQKITQGYDVTYKYNPTDRLYATYNIKDYILRNGYENLVVALSNSDDKYIDITTCQTEYLSNTDYCQSLLNFLNVKQVIFTRENTTELVSDLKNISLLSESMKDFIRYIKYSNQPTKYRLIVEFNDDKYASLKIFSEGV